MPSVGDMNSMFSFEDDISKWDVSSAPDGTAMFMTTASVNGYLSERDVPRFRDTSHMFSSADCDGVISTRDVSHIHNLNKRFLNAAAFNSDTSTLRVSTVSDVTRMFICETGF